MTIKSFASPVYLKIYKRVDLIFMEIIKEIH